MREASSSMGFVTIKLVPSLVLSVSLLFGPCGCGGGGTTTYTVTFDSQGGSGIASQTVNAGGKAVRPADPVRGGCPFEGWCREAACATQWDFTNEIVTANVTLYAKWHVYALRETGPAGGLIFFDKGSYSDGWRYLEAAPKSTEWTSRQWSATNQSIGVTSTEVGTGKANTTTIVTWLNGHSESGRAAQLCDALEYGGYDDWFLPSSGELNQMYVNLRSQSVGEFIISDAGETFYWCSSEYSHEYTRDQRFSNGEQNYTNKGMLLTVRACRQF